MNRTWLGLSALLLLNGCPEHEPQVLFVEGTIAPDETCGYVAKPGQLDKQIFHGKLDLARARDGYFLATQVFNALQTSETASGLGVEQGHLDNNTVQLVGATVSYDAQGLSVALPQGFFVPTDVTIRPQGANIGFANIFPPAVLQILRTDPYFVGNKPIQDPLIRACLTDIDGVVNEWKSVPIGGRQLDIIVRLTFEGVLQDGTEVRSNEFRFPVTVCTGCLIAGAPSACDHVVFYQGVQICGGTDCYPGQDVCTEFGSCFGESYAIDASVVDRLINCANTVAFPPPGVSGESRCSILPPYTPGDAPNLFIRYGLERADTYCSLRPGLFPPQQ